MRLPTIFFIFCLVVMMGCATGQVSPSEDEASAENVEQQDEQEAEVQQNKQVHKEDVESEEEEAEIAPKQMTQEKAPQRKKAVKKAGGQTHEVWLWQETRDCLWNLAEKYYGDPWLWKKIYIANKDQIDDPRIIYPKQILIIPPVEEGE